MLNVYHASNPAASEISFNSRMMQQDGCQKVLHAYTKICIICFHSQGGGLCLQITQPQNRTFGYSYDAPCRTLSACRVLWVIIPPQPKKIGMRITIPNELPTGSQYHSFLTFPLQIKSYCLDCLFKDCVLGQTCNIHIDAPQT